MKTLVLKDGTSIDVRDESNIANIRIDVESFDDVEALAAHFTKANMETVQLGAEEFHYVVPVTVAAVKRDGGIIVTFQNQDGVEDYVQTRIDNYTLQLIEEEVI